MLTWVHLSFLFIQITYVSIFKEQASDYRAILRLQKKDKVRDTFYAEVLDLVVKLMNTVLQNF